MTINSRGTQLLNGQRNTIQLKILSKALSWETILAYQISLTELEDIA